MLPTVQNTERKRVTFVSSNNEESKEAASQSSTSSQTWHHSQGNINSNTLRTANNENSKLDNFKDNSIVGSNPETREHRKRTSLQPIEDIDTAASNCVNFDEFLCVIKQSNSEINQITSSNNNFNTKSSVNSNTKESNNEHRNGTVSYNNKTEISNAYKTVNGKHSELEKQSKVKQQRYKRKQTCDPYAPEHQGSESSTIPLTFSSQNEESKRSVSSVNSNSNAQVYLRMSKRSAEQSNHLGFIDNNDAMRDNNSTSNSLRRISHSQVDPVQYGMSYEQQNDLSEQLQEQEEEEQEQQHELSYFEPMPSSARKRRRLQSGYEVINTISEDPEEMRKSQRSAQSHSQSHSALLHKYELQMKTMNARLRIMEKELSSKLLPLSEELTKSKRQYELLCNRLDEIERLVSSELKTTLNNNSVQQTYLSEQINNSQLTCQEMRNEMTNLCNKFTVIEQKIGEMFEANTKERTMTIRSEVPSATSSSFTQTSQSPQLAQLEQEQEQQQREQRLTHTEQNKMPLTSNQPTNNFINISETENNVNVASSKSLINDGVAKSDDNANKQPNLFSFGG